ncbi:MAG: hypothetical protein PHC93_05000 [Candidatus Omnitrophica bacterium]|nr:hypothetical protein [Candidatus Omnitrophota bacterium]
MNKVALVFIVCDRPEYFTQVLNTVNKQTLSFNNFDVYLYQDVTEKTDKVQESIELFKKHFPNGNIVKHSTNISVALNYHIACKQLFFEKDYTHIVFFEEDMILSPFYLESLIMMINKFGNDNRIGMISCSGNNILNSLQLQEENKNKLSVISRTWGFCLRKEAFIAIQSRMEEYLNLFVINKNYRSRNHSAIREWQKSRGFKPGVTSQDGIKNCCLAENNLIKLTCFPGLIKHIGTIGLHNNESSYKTYRFGEQILYDKKIEVVEDLTDDKYNEILTRERNGFIL